MPATRSSPTRSARKKRELKRSLLRWLRSRPRGAVLAEDETDLRWFPPLRAAWSPKGRPVEVEIHGGNAKRVLFGAVNVRTGSRLSMPRRYGRTADFQAFLELIRRSYRGRPVALLLDEASYHTSAGSRRTAAACGIELFWLPVRCPELNPMDHLWRHSKGVVAANRQYATMDELVARTVQHLHGLSNAKTLVKAGLRSEDCWLRRLQV